MQAKPRRMRSSRHRRLDTASTRMQADNWPPHDANCDADDANRTRRPDRTTGDLFMTVAIKSAAPGATLGEAPLLLLLKLRTFIALFAVVIFFSFAAHNFLSIENLLIMSRHVALNAFLAIGMTFVIVAGGIDLSVGSIVGLSGMIAGGLILN